MKLKLSLLLYTLLIALMASAQEYDASFNTLRLPVSSHTAALGGQNISLIEDAPAAGWSNPALYANVSDLSLGLNFMTYAASSNWMGAHFVHALGDRHTLAVGAQMMNFGKMDETDESGNVIGEVSAKDFVIGVGYSYLLSDRWSGGANLKYIVSNLAGYSAMSFAVDVGLNYYDDEQDLSVSATLQNMGAQLKAYDEGRHLKTPFALNVGFSKGLDHLPIRFHVTMTDVTRWKSSYYVLPEEKDNNKSDKVSFGKIALNHFVVGLDVLPTDYLYLSLGYNFRRAYELKAAGSSHWAGISAGAGINIKRFNFGVSYAKYHHAGNSFMANVGYKI